MLTKPKINSLTGLKVIALACIFWLHTWAPHPDFGTAWAVNFFFACSGFLVAYRYYDDPSWEGLHTAYVYWRKKFVSIWPLHVLGFLIVLCAMGHRALAHVYVFFQALVNLALLQAWGMPPVEMQMSFNGVTWFLSAILFCYLMAPIFMIVLHRVRRVFPLFCFVFALRYAIVQLPLTFPGLFGCTDAYCSPAIRCLEFCSAMCLYPLFVSFKQRCASWLTGQRGALFATGLEICGLLALAISAYAPFHKMHFALMPTLAFVGTFAFAFDTGYLSRLLGNRVLLALSVYEMEFYVFHQAVLKFLDKHAGDFMHIHILIYNGVGLAVIFACCVLWHRYLGKPASAMLSRTMAWLGPRCFVLSRGGEELQ